MDLIPALLQQLPRLLLTLIALTVAIVLVVQRRAQLGSAGRLGLLAFGLLLAGTVLQTAFYTLLQTFISTTTATQTTWIFAASSLFFTLIDAAAIVLLGVALARKPVTPPNPPHAMS